MRLANVKLPDDLMSELRDAGARLGVSQSNLHRAALRSFLASDPDRERVLHLDSVAVADLRTGAAGHRAQALLEEL